MASPDLSEIKVYPEISHDAKAPYIIYTQISGTRQTCLRGDQGLCNPHYQIDVYATTPKERSVLSKAVRDALYASDMTVIFINEGRTWEPETKLYRHRQDFSFWNND